MILLLGGIDKIEDDYGDTLPFTLFLSDGGLGHA